MPDKSTGTALYDQVKTIERTLNPNPKSGEVPYAALNETVKLNIKELVRDEAFIAVINSGKYTAALASPAHPP